MGNRAVLTTLNKGQSIKSLENSHNFAIYLHWNGSADSVVPFLEYCKIHGYRDLTQDRAYGFACLTQTIRNYFGKDGLSCGVGAVRTFGDPGDNGIFIIGEGWRIKNRISDGRIMARELIDYERVMGMLDAINRAQPQDSQIPYHVMRDFVLKDSGADIYIPKSLRRTNNDN